MSGDVLFLVLVLLPFIDWTATVILVMLARRKPRIGFLTERAFAAAIVSIVVTGYALVALNTELMFPVLDLDAARVVVRTLIVLLGVAPIVWLALYWRRIR